LWTAAVLFALGQWMERVAIGWFVLDVTGSVFLTAASVSARSAPAILLGPIAGAVSDRYPRGRVLAITASCNALVMLTVASLVFADHVSIVAILVLVAVSGCAGTFSLASLTAFAGDVVGPERRPNAISLMSVGQRAVGAAGALGGGVLIATIGPGLTFLLAAGPLAAAAMTYASIPTGHRTTARSSTSFLADVVGGLQAVLRIPIVALLLAMMVLVEIVGFSFQSLMPVVAEQVLNVGAAGLGGLVGATSVGSMLGTIVLAIVSDRGRQGMLLVGVFAVFGVMLAALGVSNIYAVSLLAACGVGAAAAMVDALEWILLQKHVPDHLRGRVLGAWGVAIGFGWVGPLILGAVADRAGTQVALVGAGMILVSAAGIIGARARSLRTA